MTDDPNISGGEAADKIEDHPAFKKELSDLIISAIMNGVSLEGAWDIETDDGQPEVTVEIYRMER